MISKETTSSIKISSLFFAITFLAIGYGMILTFVGVYLKEQGISNTYIGIINSAFFMGAIASSIFSQSIISTVGHIRSFATFASLMVISFLIHSIIFDLYVWTILRFISGFSFYALLIVLESWLNEKSSHENRGKMLAIYTIIFYLSTAIGQLFLNIDGNLKNSIFAIGSTLILFSVLFISLTKIKEPELKPFEHYSLPKIYSIVPLAATSSFIGGFFVGAFFTMIPVYILSKFESLETVSYFMLISLIAGLLSQWPIGLVSDKLGRRKVISFVAFFTAIVSSLFFFIENNTNLLYGCGFLMGLTIFSIYPLGVARANDVIDENKDVIEISRTLLFTYGIGSFIAPLAIGFLSKYNENIIFLIFSSLGLFLTFYSLSKRRIADDDLSSFVNIPVTSGLELPQLDPRNEQ